MLFDSRGSILALVWIDLEMTGLDPEHSVIIEIAVVVTDPLLNIIAEGPCLAIHQSEEKLSLMDEWNVLHHNQSGLVERVRKSTITDVMAEEQVLEFLSAYVKPNESPLCGNTIGQDRRFLFKYMPKLERFLHYRSIDVTSIKELAKRWAPTIVSGFKKQGNHKALDDIHESIEELKYYKSCFFKIPNE